MSDAQFCEMWQEAITEYQRSTNSNLGTALTEAASAVQLRQLIEEISASNSREASTGRMGAVLLPTLVFVGKLTEIVGNVLGSVSSSSKVCHVILTRQTGWRRSFHQRKRFQPAFDCYFR
jgi:hypothetical protein